MLQEIVESMVGVPDSTCEVCYRPGKSYSCGGRRLPRLVLQEMLESTVRTYYLHSVSILASYGGAAGDA